MTWSMTENGFQQWTKQQSFTWAQFFKKHLYVQNSHTAPVAYVNALGWVPAGAYT